MIHPLLAVLDELSGAVGAPAPHLELAIVEVRLNALGRTIPMRSDSPDSDDLIAEALIVEAFDDFPDPLRLTFHGRVVSVGATAAMTGLQVKITFPRAANPALHAEASAVVPPQGNGSFEAQVDVFFDGNVRRPHRLHGLATIGSASLPVSDTKVEMTNVNLDWFLDLVNEWEPKSGAPSRLAFLASLRAVVNTSTDFNFVVGTVKAPSLRGKRIPVKSLFPVRDPRTGAPSSTMAARLRDASHLRFGGESIAISHVLIGIEGGRRQEPQPAPPALGLIPMFAHPGNLVTWAGDLGGCLGGRYIPEKYYLPGSEGHLHSQPLTLDDYIEATASRADLIGDIDGVNVAAVYDDKLSLSANLRNYYLGNSAAHRFSRFVEATENAGGERVLGLVQGGPKRLTAASRQFIAEEILMVSKLILMRRTVMNKDLRAELRTWKPPFPAVEAMLRIESPEIQKLTNVLVDLVEAGLASEPP